MSVVNSLSSRLKDRYRPQINVQTTATIPASTRHELAHEIESTIYNSPQRSLSPSSPSPPSSPSSPSNGNSNSVPTSPLAQSTSVKSPRRSRRRHHRHRSSIDDKLLHELEITIEETKSSLEKMRDSETFLDIRIRKYRNLLDQQSQRLSSRHLMEGNDHIIVVPSGDEDGDNVNSNNAKVKIDVEKQSKIQNQFHQQELNEQKLKSILQMQKNILTEIEIMRRKLIDLESKREEILTKKNECEQFLIASAEVDLQQLQAQQYYATNQSMDEEDHNNIGDGGARGTGGFMAVEDSLSLEMRNLKTNDNQDTDVDGII